MVIKQGKCFLLSPHCKELWEVEHFTPMTAEKKEELFHELAVVNKYPDLSLWYIEANREIKTPETRSFWREENWVIYVLDRYGNLKVHEPKEYPIFIKKYSMDPNMIWVSENPKWKSKFWWKTENWIMLKEWNKKTPLIFKGTRETKEEQNRTMKCEKMTPEEIKQFKNAKKSKEAQYFYEDERYNPNNKVDLWNWNILYTTDRLIRDNHKILWYWIWWYHERIIWYIKIWGEYKLRMFYKSKSEWIWRACPWERNDWGYSKWETIDNFQYETTTKVVPLLWVVFDNYGINQCLKSPYEDPIDKSEDLWKLLLEKDLKKEIKVDTLFSSKELMDYLIYRLWTLTLNNKVKETDKSKISNLIKHYQKLEDSNSVLPSTSEIMRDKIKWNKVPISFEITKWIFDKLVPMWLNYSEMYKVKWENYKCNHIDFWEININVYETTRNWKKVKIHFWSVKNNHPEKIWIDNITYSDDEVSSFWTYKNPINAAPLVGKPADYDDQSPDFWEKIMDYKLPSWNMDIRDVYQDNPIIKHYKKLEKLL